MHPSIIAASLAATSAPADATSPIALVVACLGGLVALIGGGMATMGVVKGNSGDAGSLVSSGVILSLVGFFFLVLPIILLSLPSIIDGLEPLSPGTTTTALLVSLVLVLLAIWFELRTIARSRG